MNILYKKSIAVQLRGMYEARVTLYYSPTRFGSLLGLKPYNRRFVGDNTVWYEFPQGERCSTNMEYWLVQQVKRHKFQSTKEYGSWLTDQKSTKNG